MSSQQDLIKPIDAEAFISSIFAGHPADEHILIARQLTANSGGFTHSCWGGKAVQSWMRPTSIGALYFNVSTVQQPQEEGGRWRRRTRDCIAAYVLVLDDVGTKSKPVTVEPTYKLETSAGNFQWGYRINPCRDGNLYSAVVKAIANAGFGDPGAGGFNRLMRIPGSVNIKPGRNNFVSTITEWHPERCFELEDLAKKFGVVPSACHVSRVTPSPIAGENNQDDTDDMDHVLVWLKQNGHVIDDDRTEWVDVRCPWHDEHTTGSEIAGYSPLGRGEDGWRETRGFKCMHAHCAERTYQDFSSWIVGSGGPAARGFDPLPLLQRQWVIVNRGTQFADLFQRPYGGEWIYSEKEWSNMHFRRITVQHHDKPVLLKTAFMENRATRRATALKYRPGEVEVFEHRKQRYVNSWTEPLHSHTDLLPEVFLEHIQYILPIIPEQECFLDWLAYKIQHPASRSYAVVMVADNVFGTGRSWIARMLEQVTQGQSGKVTLKQLIGKGTSAEQNYNDWSAGRQFLFVNEAKDVSRDDFYNGYETFKDLVDTSKHSVRINPKFGHIREEEIFWNCLIFTNHIDAISIPANDRRIAVFTNTDKPRGTSYYERLFAALEDEEPGRVYWWLKMRDVAGFDHTSPPDTAAKRKMIEMTRDPIEELREWIDEYSGSDVITLEECIKLTTKAARELGYTKIEYNPGASGRRIWKTLDSLRPNDPNGFRLTVHDKRLECRAIRNHHRWRTAAASRLNDRFLEELEKLSTGHAFRNYVINH